MLSIKNSLCIALFFLTFLCMVGVGLKVQENNLEISLDGMSPELTMPIVINDPYAHLASHIAPNPQRGPEYRRWLQASVRIHVSRASGSGTIVYYDGQWAYIQTCGHLWGDMRNSMTGEEGKHKREKCRVDVFYHNEHKLTSPKSYDAEVLFYSNKGGPGGGHDCALVRFQPDWAPNYFPIAPADYSYGKDSRLHSTGCDGATEAAHYDVRVIGLSGSSYPHLVTTENSPRPGRSGGGLMSENYYVGICWGTSDTSGNGNGYFTPIQTIRYYNEQNGYGWLNEIGYSLARKIPIVDRNNPQRDYPKDYIPLPGGKL